MIKYALICDHDHEFEAWFSKMADYDDQSARGLIACPHCASTRVEKAIMAPNVSTSRKTDSIASERAKALSLMNEAAAKIRKEIAANCEDVGDSFAKTARDIHYGDAPQRGIYGTASPSEAKALHEEGIAAVPLPDALAPKPKKSVN